MSRVITLPQATGSLLDELAKERGVPPEEIVESAIESYRRELYLQGLADDFAKLRSRPDDWAAEMQEREDWEVTVGDGLAEPAE